MTFDKVCSILKKYEIDISKIEYDQFCKYEELLLDWNKKINLTAITDDNDIWIKHFLDSCTICKYIKENDSVIDVGTGAGFPSIPVKIINNSINLTLLDSLNKRISFLENVSKDLELKNVNFAHGRAEDIGHDKKYREQFDVATARAVANLSTLVEYCLPFVKKGGLFICMKAGNVDKEILEAKNAIKTLGSVIEKIDKFILEENIERTIIIIRKEHNISNEYPRKAGIPSKKPL